VEVSVPQKRFDGVFARPFAAVCFLLLAGGSAAETGTGASAPATRIAKVVYHADFGDPRRFSALLTSIRNMVATYEAELREYDVRVVFIASGIRFVTEDKLLKTPFAEDEALRKRRRDLLERLISLRDVYGVKLELCGITREQARLPESKLIAGVTVVPSGVVRLAELQQQGFAYIKVE